MVQNLVWATGYNLVAIPVAMGLLRALGHRPANGRRRHRHERVSTIIVAANAQLLRRLRLRRETPIPPAQPRLATA